MTHFDSDEQLVQASLAGNSTAFGQLYERYIDRIYKYLYYRSFHKETAEDLTSQTFMRALEHLSSYDVTKGTFSAWIYRIARNLLIDHVRAVKPTAELADFSELLRDTHDLTRTLEQKQQLEQIQAALRSLTPEQQELLLLRIWDERSYAEIALILEKSEASCKMAVSRALTTLRASLPAATLALLIHLLHLPPTYVS